MKTIKKLDDKIMERLKKLLALADGNNVSLHRSVGSSSGPVAIDY